MIEPKLFFGFPVADSIQEDLNQVNPHALQLFISDESMYLNEYIHEGQRYLGKMLDSDCSLSSLQLLESNIESIAKRLLPHFSLTEHPAVLLIRVAQ